MKKLISLDFDGVLFNLEALHAPFIKEHYGDDYSPLDVTHWSYIYEKYPKVTKIWNTWELYSQAPYLEGAIEFIESLKKRFGVNALQIVTSSPESIQNQKTEMILKTLGIDVIHVSKEKKSLYTKGTILIDDAIHNIQDHLENTNEFAILFDLNGLYGWNKEFKTCNRSFRATSYQEAFKCLTERL